MRRSLTLLAALGPFGLAASLPGTAAAQEASVTVPIERGISSTVPGVSGPDFGRFPTRGGTGLDSLEGGSDLNAADPRFGRAGAGEGNADVAKPAFQIIPSLEVTQFVTDNLFATSTDPRIGLLTTLSPNVAIYDTEAFASFYLNYTLNADLYENKASLDGVRHDLNATAKSELLGDRLFLDAQATAVTTQTDRAGPQTATPRSVSSGLGFGEENVITYSISPYWRQRFGDFATAEFRYTNAGSFYTDPTDQTLTTASGLTPSGQIPAQDTITNRVSASLQSGPDFSFFQWRIDLVADREDRQTDTVDQRTANIDTQYQLDREWGLLATAGYETVRQSTGLNQNLNGPTLLGGVRWTPGPRTEIIARAGIRNHEPNYSGQARYDISEATRFTASYSESVGTSQGSLLNNLGSQGFDTSSNSFVNSSTLGQFSALDPGSPTQNNSVQRIRRFQGTVNWRGDRNSMEVNLYTEDRTNVSRQLGLAQGDTTTGADARFNRALSPISNAELTLSYSTGDTGGISSADSQFRAGARVTWQVGENADITAAYNHLTRTASGTLPVAGIGNNGTESENVLSLRFHYVF